MRATLEDVRAFWDANPCGSGLSERAERRAYFQEVEAARYALEPHVPEIARFADFAGRRVLEIGCGIATDGARFAAAGADYVGVDLSPASVEIARERFELLGLEGVLRTANAEALEFPEGSFDHVYSFGVIHHSPRTEAIVDEMYRVLRPGGTFTVMVYNRSSINYRVEIMFLRRIGRWLLYPSFMPAALARLTGFDRAKLERHRQLLTRRMTHDEWVSVNTDGPDCPLAKVYSRAEALRLFGRFVDVRTEVRYFDRTHWPLLRALLPEAALAWLGRRWGWHRLVYGRKPS